MDEIKNKDITFKELIEMYKELYNSYYENELGFDEEKRKKVLIQEFNKVFGVRGTKISHKLDSHYELKYSKSKNVYTLYYLESYIVSEIDDINKLLSQKFYEQELLDLSHYPIAKEIKGIKLVDSISILDDKDKLNLLKKNLLCYSKGKMVIK